MTRENQNIEWKESWQDDYLRWVCGWSAGMMWQTFFSVPEKLNPGNGTDREPLTINQLWNL